MDKQILEQYIDACELIKDTKDEIRKLRKHRHQVSRTALRDRRMSSLTPRDLSFGGTWVCGVKDPDELERMEVLLEERIRNKKDQASGGSVAQYGFTQNPADYPVQDIRGIDLGASGGSDGSESYSG